MIPWETLAEAPVPNSKNVIKLMRRGDEYSIRVNYLELMNSRAHGSEEALASLAAMNVQAKLQHPPVLVGGLGMGYTLRASLEAFPKKTMITVAELLPEVIEWNRTHLAPLADNPLSDERVTVFEGDVRTVINSATDRFCAIILDVDNGPEGITTDKNNTLYSKRGLNAIKNALKPFGVLAIWSQSPSDLFTLRLKECGYTVSVEYVPMRPSKPQGPKNTVWIAVKGRR